MVVVELDGVEGLKDMDLGLFEEMRGISMELGMEP